MVGTTEASVTRMSPTRAILLHAAMGGGAARRVRRWPFGRAAVVRTHVVSLHGRRGEPTELALRTVRVG